jgi:hypothetical protein
MSEQSPKTAMMNIFSSALQKDNANFIYVQVKMDDFDGKELIINPRENIQKKMEYYDRAYSENLCLKNNTDIQITAYGWAECIEDIDHYVNDTRQTVSLVFDMCAGEMEGVAKVFKHEDDAERYISMQKAKHPNFSGTQYAQTYQVHRCTQTIV